MNELSPWHIRRKDFEEAEYTSAPEPEEVHLRDYWNILMRRRRVVLLVLLVFLGIAGYVNFSATPLYTASATLKIEPQDPMVTGVGDVVPSGAMVGGPYDYYQTQYALLESRALAARVIHDLGVSSDRIFTSVPVISSSFLTRFLDWFYGHFGFVVYHTSRLFEDPPQKKQSLPENKEKEVSEKKYKAPKDNKPKVNPRLVSRYRRFLDVEPVKNTRLVEVRFTTPGSELSQKLANAHVAAFIRMNLETRFELTNEAREFLDKKSEELKAKLERSEEELNRFRDEYGVVSLEKGENIIVDRLVDLNKELTQAQAGRIQAESLARMVRNKQTEHLSEVMNNNMIQGFKSSIAVLEAERSRLGTVFKPNHPRLLKLGKQIEEARGRLNREIADVVRGIESNYAAARAKEQALHAEAEKQQQEALKLKKVGVQYALLEEMVKVNRSLYENVLKRLNETNISSDLDSSNLAISNMQIAEFAELPRGPSSPRTAKNLVLAMALGLFFGVGLVFFLEYLDSSVKTSEDIWRAVSLPTLGIVPDLNSLRRRLSADVGLTKQISLSRLIPSRFMRDNSSGRELMVSHHPLSIVSESYRTIRAALLLSQAEKPPKVILLTSPHPNEGKTVTTVNLAISLAQNGHSVLVIDGDLRKGTCHNLLKRKNHPGLTEVLTGGVSVDLAVRETDVKGLSVLPRGKVPPNPPDLLGSQRMKEVLDELGERFDFILIDSPPVIAVSDATVLSVLCDGVLVVVQGQSTSKGSARQAVERLLAIHAKILGVILNSVNINDPEYVDYRHYYASYYASAPKEKEEDGFFDGSGNGSTSNSGGSNGGQIESPDKRVVEETPGTVTGLQDLKAAPEVNQLRSQTQTHHAAGIEKSTPLAKPVVESSGTEEVKTGKIIRTRDEALRILKAKPQSGEAPSVNKKLASVEAKSVDEIVRAWAEQILQGLEDLGSSSLARFAVGVFLAILLLGGVASATLQNKDRVRSLSLQTEKLLSFVGARFGILKDNIGELLVALTSGESESGNVEASHGAKPSAGPVVKEASIEEVVALKDGTKPDSRPDIQEMPAHETKLSTSSPTFSPPDTWREFPVIIKHGSTIRQVAADFYGADNLLLGISLIRDFNPQIKDFHQVSAGERLWIPPLARETLVRRQKNGSYRLIVGSFGGIMQAVEAAEIIRNRGYQVVIAPQRLSDSLLLYRVEIGGLRNLEAADRAWAVALASRWLPSSVVGFKSRG